MVIPYSHHRRPALLWRGAFLSAAGMTALWLVAVTLFLPAADYNRSYRVLARKIGQKVPAGECVGLALALYIHWKYAAGRGNFGRDQQAINRGCADAEHQHLIGLVELEPAMPLQRRQQRRNHYP